MKPYRILAALCCLAISVIHALGAVGTGKKISDYTETLTVGDAWIYEIAVPGVTNYKVTFGTMATNIIARVPGGGGGGSATNAVALLNGQATNLTMWGLATNRGSLYVSNVFVSDYPFTIKGNSTDSAQEAFDLYMSQKPDGWDANGVAQFQHPSLDLGQNRSYWEIVNSTNIPATFTVIRDMHAPGGTGPWDFATNGYSLYVYGAWPADPAEIDRPSGIAPQGVAMFQGRGRSDNVVEIDGYGAIYSLLEMVPAEKQYLSNGVWISSFPQYGIWMRTLETNNTTTPVRIDQAGVPAGGILLVINSLTNTTQPAPLFTVAGPYTTSPLAGGALGRAGRYSLTTVEGDSIVTGVLNLGLGYGGTLPSNTKLWLTGTGGVSAIVPQSRISLGFNQSPANSAYMGALNIDGASTAAVLGLHSSSVDIPVVHLRDNGRSGFGTISPGKKLAVNGSVGLGSNWAATNVNTVGLEIDLGGGSTPGLTVMRDYGNVTPTSRGGNIDLIPATTGSATPGSKLTTGYWGPTSEARLTLSAYNQANQLVLHEGGNVGFGTDAPGYKLEVNGTVRITDVVMLNNGSPTAGQVPTFRSDGTIYPSNVVATASGTNYPPVTTTGTNITVGTGVIKSLLMPTNASVGISLNGTEILGENVTLVVTNTSAAASNITVSFFQDGSASSYFDATVASNVTGFLVGSNSSKRIEFVYNGTFWRVESTLAKEMELSVAGGLSLATNSVTSIVTLSNSLSLNQLNNAGIGTPAIGDIISWNGSKWTNGVVPGGDVISNITVSATNNVILDFAAANIFKLMLLTNWTETFTNVTSLTKKGYVYYQQDTNGSRILNNYSVSGGLLQTNASENMQPTTNANALDLLELMPGFFTTNLIAYWPQDFQPRIKFTNSLHAFLSFIDTFNRSNADPMSTTASDGHSWTSGPGALAEPRIVSSMLFGNAGQTGCRVLTPTFGGNQRASLTLIGNVGALGPMVHVQSTVDASGYFLVADDSTHLAIYELTDTGSLATSVLFTSAATPTMVAGDTITLTINGITLECFLNGVSYGTVDDATFSGGQPGIWMNSDSASGGPFTASEQ